MGWNGTVMAQSLGLGSDRPRGIEREPARGGVKRRVGAPAANGVKQGGTVSSLRGETDTGQVGARTEGGAFEIQRCNWAATARAVRW